MKILPNKINKFFDSILSKLSVQKKDRNLLIKSLLDSSIRGVDSHGIRLFSHYVKCIENGRIKAKPKMKLIKKNRGVAVYDADDGLGHVAALKASAIVSSMAKKNGIASIGIINSSHYGAAGVYSMDIAQKHKTTVLVFHLHTQMLLPYRIMVRNLFTGLILILLQHQ